MIWQSVIGGILLGGLYAASALGFSLVWGVLGIVNLAHAALITMGSYLSFLIFTHLGLDPFLALPLGLVAMFLVGYTTQKFILNRVFREGLAMSLIVTFGLGLVITYSILLIFSADFRGVILPYTGDSYKIGDLFFPYTRVGILATSILLVAGLSLFLSKTKVGLSIQATALNREAAQLVGMNTPRVYAITYGLGAAITGASGMLASVVYSVHPYMGDPFVSRAFAITVLAGMGNVGGTLLAGIILGLAESLGVLIIGPGYQEAIASGMVVLILLVRPTGLFGRQYFAGTKGG
jgi:branched-chain amino acid transport system permease protein